MSRCRFLKHKFIVILTIILSCRGFECYKGNNEKKPTPIVLWHGMGDSCCFPFSLGPFQEFLQREIKNVYINSIKIGSNIPEDVENGYFMSPNEQVDNVCQQLANDSYLKNGFHAIGFSQGAQFFRAVIQRCGPVIPPVKNFISLGGQHQGVYGLPNCAALQHEVCDYIRRLLNYAAYSSFVQNHLVQATYWHDPLNEDGYVKNSIFLADINNERAINKSYIRNLRKLDHFVLVKFNEDTIVQPKETEWFGFYKPGQDKEMQTLQESDLYKNDRLGLKQMEADGQLIFLASDGNHLKFSEDWFIDNVLKPFLL